MLPIQCDLHELWWISLALTWHTDDQGHERLPGTGKGIAPVAIGRVDAGKLRAGRRRQFNPHSRGFRQCPAVAIKNPQVDFRLVWGCPGRTLRRGKRKLIRCPWK